MRVVFIRSNPVDPDSRVEKEVDSLIKAGYKVEVLAWDRDSKYKYQKSQLKLNSGNVVVHRFGIPATYGGGIKRNLLPLFKFQIKLAKWLYMNRDRYDTIHACDFDTAFTAFKMARKYNKKFIYDIFDYYVDSFRVPKYLKGFIEKQDHNIINSADAVIICSEKREEQIAGTTPQKLEVIHNTPSKPKLEFTNLHLDENKVKIVYVGILSDGRFIKETADIVKENQEYEFHIGGFGKLESYFQKMSDEYPNIIYYGKLPYDRTLEIENSCDIMIAIYNPSIPNHYYAAPNKFYEALMLGKPLIMAKNTGMDEVVSRYNIGEVINYDKKSLENAIQNIVRLKAKWPEMSSDMKKIYLENYSWDEMEKRLLLLYKSI